MQPFRERPVEPSCHMEAHSLQGTPNLAAQSITDFAARHGVTTRTVRFYEAFGLLHPVRIGTSRYFSKKDSMRLDLTLTAKRLGFSLREIRDLIDAHIARANKEPRDIVEVVDVDTMKIRLNALEKQRAQLEDALEQLRVVASER